MNADKLLTLLDQHSQRQTAYRQLSARYRSSVNDVAKQQAGLTIEVDDLAQSIVVKPASELARVSSDEIAAAGIAETQFKRLLAAKRLADRLYGECEALAAELKQSQELANRLTEYSRQHGDSFQL